MVTFSDVLPPCVMRQSARTRSRRASGADHARSPLGTVTFLFTDIEGSTARWEQDQAARQQETVEQLGLFG